MRAVSYIEHLNCFFNGKKNRIVSLLAQWSRANHSFPWEIKWRGWIEWDVGRRTYVWALRTGALAWPIWPVVCSSLSKCPWGTNFHAKSHFVLYHSLYFKWGKRNLTFCWLCMPGLLQQLWSVQGLNLMWHDVWEIWIKNLITLPWCISLYSWRCHHPLWPPKIRTSRAI